MYMKFRFIVHTFNVFVLLRVTINKKKNENMEPDMQALFHKMALLWLIGILRKYELKQKNVVGIKHLLL